MEDDPLVPEIRPDIYFSPIVTRRIRSDSPEGSYSPTKGYRHPMSATLKTNKMLPGPSHFSHSLDDSTYMKSLKLLALNTLPLVIIYLAMFSVRNISLHFIKQKNDTRLTNAIGVGNTLVNVVGLAVFMSLNAGLISRAAQAYGAKNLDLVGFFLHRSLIINVFALIPGSLVLYFADFICVRIGFDPDTAHIIQRMGAGCIVGIYAMMVYNTLSSYLYSCDIFFPSAAVLLLSTAVFWILSYMLFQHTDLDVMAVAISFDAMQVTAAFLMFIYIFVKQPIPGSFFWFKKQSFQDLWTLFHHEVLVGSMMFFEWIALEIIYLFAGRLPPEQLSALTILYTNYQTLYAVPMSLADTVLAFVGNAMGEGNIKKAKNSLKAGLTLSVASLVIIEAIYIFLKRQTSQFYTNDEKTIEEAIKLFGVYTFYFPPDFIQIILSSGLRAIGKEKLGSIMFILCYYCMAIPLAYIFCFSAGYEVVGLVMGPLISLYFMLIWLAFSYLSIDWEKQVRFIKRRVHEDDKALEQGQEDEQQLKNAALNFDEVVVDKEEDDLLLL